MSFEVKLLKIGDSLGIVLPEEALQHLGAEEGDSLTLTETTFGYQMAANDPEFAKVMNVFQDLAQRYPNTLAELAK